MNERGPEFAGLLPITSRGAGGMGVRPLSDVVASLTSLVKVRIWRSSKVETHKSTKPADISLFWPVHLIFQGPRPRPRKGIGAKGLWGRSHVILVTSTIDKYF